MSADAGLILSPGAAGRCDDHRLGGAVVDHDPVTGVWRMWYYCRDRSFDGPPTLGTGYVAHARSADGVRWERVDGPLARGAVLAPDDDPAAFDAMHIGVTDVTQGSGGWRMWYFGGDRTPRATQRFGSVPGLGMRPGLAISDDGVHWRRVPGHGGGGGLLPLPEERIYSAWPNTVWDGRRFLLYVTEAASDLSDFATRIWASTDLRDWTPLGLLHFAGPSAGYDAGGLVTRQVLANPLPGGRRHLMVYTAVDAAHRRSIAAADSDDGIAWHRLYREPIFTTGAPGAWDSLGVAATRLVVAHGRLFFYYYGFQTLGDDAGRRGIGLATAPIGDLRCLTRWTGT